MRAAVALRVDADDPLSALDVRDGWPTPEVPCPGAGDVRVRLAATTVNMHDLWALRGVGVRRDSFPRVLGCDITGWDERGNEVLVTGSFADPDAGGGDTAATAMARAAGLHVSVTSRSEDKRRRALEIGAHEAVPTGERLREPVDIVVDTVGAATWKHSLRSVRPGGRILTLGATTGSDAPLEPGRVFYQPISIIGSTSGSRADTLQMLRFMEAARLRPVIDSVFPLERIREAFARMMSPTLFGNVVVDIAAS